MSWRTVIITKSAKLDYKMGYLCIRQDEVKKIHISEIALLLLETTAISLTSSLLCELTKKKVKVIFCDEKRNPISELVGYYGSHDCSAKIRLQVNWDNDTKAMIWTEIVTEKIRKQMEFLEVLSRSESKLLGEYVRDVSIGDVTNREGHAAKVYFNAVYGMEFTRTSEDPINAALNYGYSIILSAFTREIVASGYLTQLGVFHDNMFNQFNLASDLMEPFRILVDRCVYYMKPKKLEHDEKMEIVNILNEEIVIDGKKQYVVNAIRIYVKSVFDAINEKDVSLIRFYRNEL